MTRFLRMLLWIMSLPTRLLHWMRRLVLPTRGNDLDPEVCAQLIQANARAYLFSWK